MLFVKDVLLLHECHRSLNILVFRDPLPPILSLMFYSECLLQPRPRGPCIFILCLFVVKKYDLNENIYMSDRPETTYDMGKMMIISQGNMLRPYTSWLCPPGT